MGNQPYRVGISGSYGGLNLGDEAILESVVRQLRASVPAEITVFTRDAEDTLRRHDVDHAVPVRQMTRDEARTEVAQQTPGTTGVRGTAPQTANEPSEHAYHADNDNDEDL